MTTAYLPASVKLNDSIHAPGEDTRLCNMNVTLLISCLMWKTAVHFKVCKPQKSV